MIDTLFATLKDHLSKMKKHNSFLMAHMLMINHIILVALWFTLTIWIGDPSNLKTLEAIIVTFLWAGQKYIARNWVDFETTTRSKEFGGLGLLSISDQVKALLAKLIIWALGHGTTP